MRKVKKTPLGRLVTNSVILEPHEHITIDALLLDGKDVEILVKSHTPRTKSADIFMTGLIWEMKSPEGKTLRAIERIIRRGIHQSDNIIIDLRRTSLQDVDCIRLLERLFKNLRSLRRLWVIDKNGKIKKYKK